MKQKKAHPNSPIIIGVDKDLDRDMEKYLQRSPFKEKLEKANEILKKAPLPKFSK